MSRQFKVHKPDINLIHRLALDDFKSKSNRGLEPGEFMARCFIDAVVTWLNKNELDIKLEYNNDGDFKVID